MCCADNGYVPLESEQVGRVLGADRKDTIRTPVKYSLTTMKESKAEVERIRYDGVGVGVGTDNSNGAFD